MGGGLPYVVSSNYCIYFSRDWMMLALTILKEVELLS